MACLLLGELKNTLYLKSKIRRRDTEKTHAFVGGIKRSGSTLRC